MMKTKNNTPEKTVGQLELTANSTPPLTASRPWTLGCGVIRATPTVSDRLRLAGVKSLGVAGTSGSQLFSLTLSQSNRLKILDFYNIHTFLALLTILLPTDSDIVLTQLNLGV